jgi:hypothetical protein
MLWSKEVPMRPIVKLLRVLAAPLLVVTACTSGPAPTEGQCADAVVEFVNGLR